MNGSLSGQVALVTGGGSGIGLECARSLAGDGAIVVIAGRDEERLAAARAELVADHPGAEVITSRCDVTAEADVEATCAVAADAGNFSMVVVNAGYGSAAPFHRTTLDEWNGVLATNLTGAFLTMRTAAPLLVANGGGSIVAVSSIAGVSTHRFMTAYCVSKAGLEMLVKQVADELGAVGVRANAVRPGLVPTDATEGMMSIPAIVDDYMDQMPLGRAGTTDDIAGLVRFLLGPESAWITGACISADGGHHLRRGPNMDPIMQMLHGDDATIQPPSR
ncbi:SDR family NAD(P)-dependent oxidoreductase [Ilumatobacter nonamiensis]|uniref:SDR family NAD(P)-dependent oxidoreductase n=1 Tax=Ilumatobacter nonamiensis TaxID=467093 RepID=UPI00034DE9D9|nr:SDR family NAD(P)-dependent oxidoreductase [Ilumatobacter nonamiensis]